MVTTRPGVAVGASVDSRERILGPGTDAADSSRDDVVAANEGFTSDSWFVARGVWMAGISAAVCVGFLSNLRPLSRWSGDHTTDFSDIAWSTSWAVEPSGARTAVLGLAAVVATISVAMVAALWRPNSASPESRLTTRRSTNLLALSAYLGASFSVTFAVLALKKAPVQGALLLGVAAVTTVVAVAIRGKVDAAEWDLTRRLMRHRRDHRRDLLARYEEANPELSNGSAWRAWAQLAGIVLLPAAAALLTELVTIFAFHRLADPTATPRATPPSWGTLPALQALLLVHCPSYVLGYELLGLREMFAGLRMSVWPRHLAAASSAVFSIGSAVILMHGVFVQDSAARTVLAAESVLLAPLTAFAIVACALSGRGWGTCMKRFTLARLKRQAKVDDANYRSVLVLARPRPSLSPRQFATRTRRRRRPGT